MGKTFELKVGDVGLDDKGFKLHNVEGADSAAGVLD